MFESVFNITADSAISVGGSVLTLLVSFVLGIVISFTYMKTCKNGAFSQSFALALVMLPMIVAIIILMVGSNVARAFSLAGAFSLVRFRSAPGDSKDITYIFFAMAIGLAVGTGYLAYAVLFAVALCIVMVVLNLLNFGTKKQQSKILKITIPEDLDYQGAFDDVFARYQTPAALQKVRTTDLGSLFELVYTVNTPKDLNEKEFLDALRCRNGNLSIILSMNADTVNF